MTSSPRRRFSLTNPKSTIRHPQSKHPSRRPLFEALESRELLAGEVFPNDPLFSTQWPLHNTGQAGGIADKDIDAPEAWSVTTGSMTTVVAVLDNGIDYTAADLYLNIWLNPGETGEACEFAQRCLGGGDGQTVVGLDDRLLVTIPVADHHQDFGLADLAFRGASDLALLHDLDDRVSCAA